MLEVRRLHILLVVADEGSFTAAARRLYMTQSAVSQQMSALEREVGTMLLQRLSRGIKLTPAGEFAVARAKNLFGDIASLESELRRFGGTVNEVRLGAFMSAGVGLLPRALKSFAERCPEVKVVMHAVPSTRETSSLLEGETHLLLTWDFDFDPRSWDPALAQVHLLNDPLDVLLPVGHPLAHADRVELSDFADERWVTRSHQKPYEGAYDKMFRLAGIDPNIVFRSEDYQSAQSLVAAGFGVSLAPRLSVYHSRPDLVVRALSGPTFVRRIIILTLPEAIRTSPAEDLICALRESAGELVPQP